jgi:pyruvate/2-oxoglutarate dehydrogenase complex dihydrolipoamide dehydrogenase (E3) component
VVIVATGARPTVPQDIPGIDRNSVVTAHEVLAGHKACTARKVVVVGGGMVGCETADLLALPSDNFAAAPTEVTLVEMRDDLALDCVAETRFLLLERLREKRVRIVLQAELKEILDDGVVFTREGREETIRGVEYVILALGAKPVDNLSTALKDKVPEVHVIGDASQARKILEATAEAARIARMI